MAKSRPPKFTAYCAICVALLPLLLVGALLGTPPYRLYRKAFERPAFVNAMIGMTGIGLFWVLYLVSCIIAPRSRYEMYMIAPPLISSLVLAIAASGIYLWWSQAVAIGLICLLLVLWLAYLPYKAGFRLTIGWLQTRERRRRGPEQNEDGQLPTRATIAVNIIGILAVSATSGYFAGGLVGAMKMLVVVVAILASAAGYIIGIVHAMGVYGPRAMYGRDDEALSIAA